MVFSYQILILENKIKLDEFLELFCMKLQCSGVLGVVRITLTFRDGGQLLWSDLPCG